MIGQTIGRYRIDAELGRGGMGVVYRATQTNLGRTVALKMLSPQFAESGEHLARFRREAEVLARLQHENIVHIYDVEEVGGFFCIIMEYVAGPSLGSILARHGALPAGAVREIGVQLTAGLEVAHRKGIVHRDLKPDNILFTPEGRPRITDFGIARIAGGDAMERTRTGILMGTPYYMSPEQARGGEITGSSDLYSLGVMLYQLLSGRVPFHGADPISLAIKHMQAPVPPLATTMPGLPGDLVGLVGRALEKEPHRRFGSAAEMGAALRVLKLEPVALSLFAMTGEAAGDEAVVACPECEFQVHAAFVTCPRCALPLRATVSDGEDDVHAGAQGGDSSYPRAEPRAGAVDVEPPAPPRLQPVEAAHAGTAPAPGNRSVRAAALAGLMAGAWREWWPGSGREWLQPRGRWGIPPVLVAGMAIVVVAATLGFLNGAPAHGRGGLANVGAEAGLVAGGSGRPVAGGGNGGGSGGSVTRGGDGGALLPGGGGLPGRAGGGGASGGGGSAPPEDRAAPASPGAPARDGADGSDRADGSPRPDAPESSAPADSAPASQPRAVVEDGSLAAPRTGGTENVPASFDIERARRDLVGIVDRQRRATESGDTVMFVRDLSPELGRGAGADLMALHQQWDELRSEMWDLTIYFEDSTRARVDFHVRITGVPARRGARRVVQDTHLYWTMAHRSGRWVIIEATSAAHDGGRR